MEWSPALAIGIIGLLVTILGIFGGIVAGFVRTESRTNSNSEDIKELFRHAENAEIHHRSDDLDRRFDTLIAAITKIETSIEKLMERLDRILIHK